MRPDSTVGYLCAASECPACEGRGSTWTSPAGRKCVLTLVAFLNFAVAPFAIGR
jgi:hypothetical protein